MFILHQRTLTVALHLINSGKQTGVELPSLIAYTSEEMLRVPSCLSSFVKGTSKFQTALIRPSLGSISSVPNSTHQKWKDVPKLLEYKNQYHHCSYFVQLWVYVIRVLKVITYSFATSTNSESFPRIPVSGPWAYQQAPQSLSPITGVKASPLKTSSDKMQLSNLCRTL